MAIYKGVHGAVTVAGTTISGCTAWQVEIAASDLNSTTFGGTWLSLDSGILNWSASIDTKIDDDKTQAAFWNAMIDGSPITVNLAMLINGSYFTGLARVTSSAPQQEHDNLATKKWKVVGIGPLTKYRSEAYGPMLLLMTQMVMQ